MANKNKRRKPYSFLARLVATISWCTVILLTLCSLSVLVSPRLFGYVGVFGLGFPFFLFGVLTMLFVSLLLAPRTAWIPLVGLLLNFISIRNYYPVNISSPPPKGSVKILSFNTAAYGGGKVHDAGRKIAEYMAKSKADIICVQEADVDASYMKNDILPLMRRHTPHSDTVRDGRSSTLQCFSRWPIAEKKLIASEGNNVCAVFKILLGPTDTLHLINVHLKSVDLSNDERNEFSGIVHRKDSLNSEVLQKKGRTIVSKLSASSEKRAQQVDQLAAYLEAHQGENIILCGDFNDTPISYAHHRVSTFLKDCYAATGNGLGRSFMRYGMIVRIDNIFCSSSHWKPFSCRVETDINLSDHYPISCYLKRKRDNSK